MKTNRAKLAAAFLGGLVVAATAMVLAGAGPNQPAIPPHVIGISNNGQYVYRAWSDGRVEINDTYGDMYKDQHGYAEEWKGWKTVK